MNIYPFTPRKDSECAPNSLITLQSPKKTGESQTVEFNVEVKPLTDAEPMWGFQLSERRDGFKIGVNALISPSESGGLHIEVYQHDVFHAMRSLMNLWRLYDIDEDDE